MISLLWSSECHHKRVSNRRNYKLPTFAPAEPSTGAACPGARVAIHQLCNCCHYYLLSTIHYLDICSPIHPEGMLHLSPHPSLSATPGFSLPLLHSQGLIITPGVPMTLTRDTWHVARRVPGARCGPFVRCPHHYQLQPAVISLGTELLHYKCDLLVVSSREEYNL